MRTPTHTLVVASQTLNRVVALEEAMATMVASVTRLSVEMREFKDEMREFKDEMREFKDEMREFKDESRARMASADEAAQRDRRDLNRRLGEIANAQGRLVEDFAAPSVPRVLRMLLGLAPDAPVAPCGPRLRLRHPKDPARTRELDVIAAHDGIALVVEVKSQLAPERVTEFAASLAEAREYLEPLGIREVIGAVATLYADPSIVTRASRLGLLVLAVGDEMLEPKNERGFEPRRVT